MTTCAFLARSLKKDSKEPQHRKALDQVFPRTPMGFPRGDLVTGYNPPWIKTALAELPQDVNSFCLGKIPSEWRRILIQTLGLRACPSNFVCSLKQQGDGAILSLSLYADKVGMEQIVLEDLESSRRQALPVLLDRYPALCLEPAALALVGQTLKSMSCGVHPGSGCVRASVQVSGPTWMALRDLLKRAAQPEG